MLARLAENLFWAGRYVERAEDTARMVDVTYHGLLESAPEEATLAWGQLLDVLHLTSAYEERYGAVEPGNVVRFLVLDAENPGSIVSSVGHARENGRSVRELVSTELWESVNSLYLELRTRDLQAEVDHQPYELFAFIKRRCQTVVGVATETMPRDDGWRFLTLGRMLERAEMTCRLLNVRFQQLVSADAPMSFHHWVAVLKSASGYEAYRRAYRASMEAAHVVEFLLLSPDFPRSVLFAVQAAESQLIRLSAEGHGSRSRRLVGRQRAALEYTGVDELMHGGLHEFLDDIQEGVTGVASVVALEFFRHAPAGGFRTVATS